MQDCVFCKIVAGKLPSFKIYEDESYLAFLSIFPVAKGHTLVIPKKHYRWVWDVADVEGYFGVCRKLARHFQKVSGNDSVYSFVFGEEVPHAHVWLVPGLDIDEQAAVISAVTGNARGKLDEDEASAVVEKLRLE